LCNGGGDLLREHELAGRSFPAVVQRFVDELPRVPDETWNTYMTETSNALTSHPVYQFLNQFSHGLDLSTGVRLKSVGFHPDQGEVEFLLAAGRRFGHFELVLNGVFGVETGGESGKDVEAKAFARWRFNEAVRAGIDGRLQAEVSDEALPAGATPPTGRDYDLTVGPTLSWMVTRTIQVQGLVGLAQPKKTDITSATAAVYASFDF